MPLPQRLLNGRKREFMIEHLLEGSKLGEAREGERQLLNLTLPSWQRPASWSREQQVRFIEGIFLGLGCGYYVVNGCDWEDVDGEARPKPMSGWLLDGQQRIRAIQEFVQGGLVVFGDVTYEGLGKVERMRFGRESFPCHELDFCQDVAALKELYLRMNFGGTPHTQADKDLVLGAS